MASRKRTGVAAILAGQGPELPFHIPEALSVAVVIGGIVMLAAALWRPRELVGATRWGRAGIHWCSAAQRRT